MSRLIDADALERDAKMLYSIHDLEPVKGYTQEQIAAAPTIDPVRHGRRVVVCADDRGVETEIEEQCALCGRVVCRYDTQPPDDYCPSCGAKMDGGEQNG